MQPLTDEFLNQCPVENGFRMRGLAMTRIEVFVDAAFAFAVTMLVISIDQIPRNLDELMDITKYIPAFILSVAQLAYIWHNHSVWSRKFGLEDTKTVFWSVSLLIVVLIFIYPLKIIFEGFFAWITSDFLPSNFNIQSYAELRYLFQYFAIGFLFISLIFMGLYRHALNNKDYLKLSKYEIFNIKTSLLVRLSMAGVCLLALVTPALLPDDKVPFAGFAYSILWPVIAFINKMRNHQWKNLTQ